MAGALERPDLGGALPPAAPRRDSPRDISEQKKGPGFVRPFSWGQARSSLGEPMTTYEVIAFTCGKVPSTSV